MSAKPWRPSRRASGPQAIRRRATRSASAPPLWPPRFPTPARRPSGNEPRAARSAWLNRKTRASEPTRCRHLRRAGPHRQSRHGHRRPQHPTHDRPQAQADQSARGRQTPPKSRRRHISDIMRRSWRVIIVKEERKCETAIRFFRNRNRAFPTPAGNGANQRNSVAQEHRHLYSMT